MLTVLVLCPQHPGDGNARLAEDLYQLLKSIGVEKAHILGFSIGGRIAFELALKHPELVISLIISNSSVGIAPPPSEESKKHHQALLELLNRV